jgi:hypothetical protein
MALAMAQLTNVEISPANSQLNNGVQLMAALALAYANGSSKWLGMAQWLSVAEIANAKAAASSLNEETHGVASAISYL